jgi:hypothetical protein
VNAWQVFGDDKFVSLGQALRRNEMVVAIRNRSSIRFRMLDTTTTTGTPGGDSEDTLHTTGNLSGLGSRLSRVIRLVVCSEGGECHHQSLEI